MRIRYWSSDVCSSDLDPVRGKAARGLERQDARQGAIIGETHRLQPMVEGAGAEVAAPPFGNARPERGGIAAHRPLSRILPIAMSALPHLVCPLDPPPLIPRTPAPVAGAARALLRRLRRAQAKLPGAWPERGRIMSMWRAPAERSAGHKSSTPSIMP